MILEQEMDTSRHPLVLQPNLSCLPPSLFPSFSFTPTPSFSPPNSSSVLTRLPLPLPLPFFTPSSSSTKSQSSCVPPSHLAPSLVQPQLFPSRILYMYLRVPFSLVFPSIPVPLHIIYLLLMLLPVVSLLYLSVSPLFPVQLLYLYQYLSICITIYLSHFFQLNSLLSPHPSFCPFTSRASSRNFSTPPPFLIYLSISCSSSNQLVYLSSPPPVLSNLTIYLSIYLYLSLPRLVYLPPPPFFLINLSISCSSSNRLIYPLPHPRFVNIHISLSLSVSASADSFLFLVTLYFSLLLTFLSHSSYTPVFHRLLLTASLAFPLSPHSPSPPSPLPPPSPFSPLSPLPEPAREEVSS